MITIICAIGSHEWEHDGRSRPKSCPVHRNDYYAAAKRRQRAAKARERLRDDEIRELMRQDPDEPVRYLSRSVVTLREYVASGADMRGLVSERWYARDVVASNKDAARIWAREQFGERLMPASRLGVREMDVLGDSTVGTLISENTWDGIALSERDREIRELYDIGQTVAERDARFAAECARVAEQTRKRIERIRAEQAPRSPHGRALQHFIRGGRVAA